MVIGVRPEKVTTKAREVTYLNSMERSYSRYDDDFDEPADWKSQGREIVEEVLSCPGCAKKAVDPEICGSVTRNFVRPRPKMEKRRRPSYDD